MRSTPKLARKHRQALRTLWRCDPIFSLRDGLTAYDEDYTAIGKVEQVVRTARVGQGYLAKQIREQSPDGVRRERETAAKSAPADRGAAANDPPASADAADETSLLDHPEKT